MKIQNRPLVTEVQAFKHTVLHRYDVLEDRYLGKRKYLRPNFHRWQWSIVCIPHAK